MTHLFYAHHYIKKYRFSVLHIYMRLYLNDTLPTDDQVDISDGIECHHCTVGDPVLISSEDNIPAELKAGDTVIIGGLKTTIKRIEYDIDNQKVRYYLNHKLSITEDQVSLQEAIAERRRFFIQRAEPKRKCFLW